MRNPGTGSGARSAKGVPLAVLYFSGFPRLQLLVQASGSATTDGKPRATECSGAQRQLKHPAYCSPIRQSHVTHLLIEALKTT
jgi:hypothetical protein